MPYAADSRGCPVVLVSDLAVHTRNLEADDRASLLVTEPDSDDRDPLGLPRVTLLGRCRVVSGKGSEEREGEADGDGEADDEAVRGLYLDRHPGAGYWVDYPDFHFRRMEVEEAYFVGGFGVMGWVTGEEYREAEPDPLRDAASSILEHVNQDHREALLLLARDAGIDDADEALMTSVDRLGYHLRVQAGKRARGLRIGFPYEARTPSRVREALVEQVRRARERA